MFKKLWSWFIEAIKETLNLSWTLVGLVIATLTLTGSAQQVTGLATVITLGIWLLTIGFRKWVVVVHINKKIQVLMLQFVVISTDTDRRYNETNISKNTVWNRCN